MHSLKIETEDIEVFADGVTKGHIRPNRVYLDGNEICCRSLVLDMGVDRVSTVTMDIFLDDVDVEVIGEEGT